VGDTVVAARTSTPSGTVGNPVYLIPDRQGTDTLAIDSNTYSVTRRQFLPFGQDRTTTPDAWPGGSKGYVGGTDDSATGMETLGARQYDPTTGRFLSADPVLETDDPVEMGGYDYAGNDPVTNSDPTGMMIFPTCGCAVNGPGPKPRPKPHVPAQVSAGGGHLTDGGNGDPFRRPVVHRPVHRPIGRATVKVKRPSIFHAAWSFLTRRVDVRPWKWGHAIRRIGAMVTDTISAVAGVVGTVASVVAIGCTLLGQFECTAAAEGVGLVAGAVGLGADAANMAFKGEVDRTVLAFDAAAVVGFGWSKTLKPLEELGKTGKKAAKILANKPVLGLGIGQSAFGINGTVKDFRKDPIEDENGG
jgi:RHS repeat-associated protein